MSLPWQSLDLSHLCIAVMQADVKFSQAEFLQIAPAQEWQLGDSISHPIRREEFLKGRLLAHLLEPHLPPLLRSKSGAPQWPASYTGSITHKQGLVMACVQKTNSIESLGIDIEDISLLSAKLIPQICSDWEQKHFFTSSSKASGIDLKRLAIIFSVKESLFKCLHPLTGIWFGFKDAHVLHIDEHKQSVSIQLQKTLSSRFQAGQEYQGLYESYRSSYHPKEHILSAVWVKNA